MASDHQHQGLGSRIGLGRPARTSSPRMGTGDVGHHHSPVSQPLASKSLEESYHQSVSDENAHFCESASVNEWQGLGRLTEGGQGHSCWKTIHRCHFFLEKKVAGMKIFIWYISVNVKDGQLCWATNQCNKYFHSILRKIFKVGAEK